VRENVKVGIEVGRTYTSPRSAESSVCPDTTSFFHPGGFSVIRVRLMFVLLLVLPTGCAGHRPNQAILPEIPDDFGLLLMAHGGSTDWNGGVVAAVAPLRAEYPVEVAFGMADAVSIQDAIGKLEARGVRRIGVVRLFISGESWYDRTEQILGLRPGAPEPPVATSHLHGSEHGDSDQIMGMEFWKVKTASSFALSTQGLANIPAIGAVLVDRVRALSRKPELEDVLILAHGAGDDSQNERWRAYIDARAVPVREFLPFRRVEVETLREDWPEKRAESEQRIRAYVKRASDEGGTAIVIPFRVYGFGPYAQVLDSLDYVSDGQGLIPHVNVTNWIAEQARTLRNGSFRSVVR